MVQPDISGFSNAAALQAAFDFGIRYIIDDTSRPGWDNPSPNAGFVNGVAPSPNASIYPPGSNPPPILVVPRRPSNLFYNLSTPAEFVSEYNCFYGPNGTCAGGQFRYWPRDLSYTEILDKESDMWLQYLLKWDVDPLMFHQANLRAYDGTRSLLGDLVDATLAKYNQMVNLPIRSEAQHDLGVRVANRMAYNASGLTAVLTPCSNLTLSVTQPALVPLTGVIYGTNQEVYGGQNISYVQATPGAPVIVPVTCQ